MFRHLFLQLRTPLYLLLAFSLCLSPFATTVAAQEEGDDDAVEPYKFEPIVKPYSFPDPLVLDFTEVSAALKKGSPVLMSTKANREVLFYNRSQLAERQRTANISTAGLGEAMGGLNQMRSTLDSAFTASSTAGQQIPATDWLLKSAIDAQLAMTQSQLASQATTAATADKGYASGGEMSAGIDQMDDAALQVLYSGMALYQGYWSIERQIQRLEEELALLRRQHRVITLLEEMGRTTSQTIKSVVEGITAMEHGLTTAHLEKKSLLTELNLMLGRPADSTLELLPIPLPDLQEIQSLDYETAWKAVYKESYTLKAKKHVQGGLQEQYDDVKKTFGEFGDRAWRAEQQLEGAKLNTALTAEQLQARFSKFYQKIQQMITSYELELEKLATAEAKLTRILLRSELGYSSESEVLTVRNECNKQKATVDQAKDDLALAWQCWLLVLQGMDLSVAERV